MFKTLCERHSVITVINNGKSGSTDLYCYYRRCSGLFLFKTVVPLLFDGLPLKINGKFTKPKLTICIKAVLLISK